MELNLDPIYIAGIGAIGSDIATRISTSDYPCVLLLKNEKQYKHYLERGLTVHYPDKTVHSTPKAHIITEKHDKIRYLFICVKAYDIVNVLTQLKNYLDSSSIIIIIHNGMGISETIENKFPQLRIITGISYVSAYREKQFKVRTYFANDYHFGPSIGQFSRKEIDYLSNILTAAHIPFIWIDDIFPHILNKFAINCCINILSVYHDCNFNDLLNHTDDLKKLTKEVASIIKIYNPKISYDSLFDDILKLINLVGENYSSTYQDVKKGKMTELSYLNGYLTKLAYENNIRLPFNDYLLNELTRRGVKM